MSRFNCVSERQTSTVLFTYEKYRDVLSYIALATETYQLCVENKGGHVKRKIRFQLLQSGDVHLLKDQENFRVKHELNQLKLYTWRRVGDCLPGNRRRLSFNQADNCDDCDPSRHKPDDLALISISLRRKAACDD